MVLLLLISIKGIAKERKKLQFIQIDYGGIPCYKTQYLPSSIGIKILKKMKAMNYIPKDFLKVNLKA